MIPIPGGTEAFLIGAAALLLGGGGLGWYLARGKSRKELRGEVEQRKDARESRQRFDEAQGPRPDPKDLGRQIHERLERRRRLTGQPPAVPDDDPAAELRDPHTRAS